MSNEKKDQGFNFIPKLIDTKIAINISPSPELVIMKLQFALTEYDKENGKVVETAQEPQQTYMTEQAARKLLAQLKAHFESEADFNMLDSMDDGRVQLQ
ncbi:hypothetical protein I2492_04340 [Budviciaceae bacterium CWB-B4]|uniref:Uncharacterized protein n=1 Tax=Limnobaculum xujianqingii TaxID=2738837 RepID=A0A9D7AGE7_9GAMM|nr:hypothetical protein [Limnobaculum xujianqingii]MBK5072244.1 hypothetical protein [Limnobaculum xujianqingii]MBK5175553.1 hypothetical protein [Limnobaculum xujianqingii]